MPSKRQHFRHYLSQRAQTIFNKHNLPFIIVLLLYLLFNTTLLFGLAMSGDGTLLFYPTEFALAAALKNGSLPFWTSTLQAGFPLVADGQPSSLYLPNILLFGSLPTIVAHNLVIFIHGLLGLVFSYKWSRLLKLSTISAATIAFIYTMTTPLTSANMPHAETLAWTPAILYFSEKYLQRKSAKQLWLLAVIVGLQWMAGFPQIAFYTLVTVGLYMAARVATLPAVSHKERIRYLLGWGIAIALGLLLAAPQLITTQELAAASIRAGGLQGSMANERSLLPIALITLWQPSWKPFFSAAGLGSSIYLGIIPIILALIGLSLSRRWPWFWPLLVTAVVTLILSWGRYNPAFSLINQLPGFSSFRVPSRFLEMTQLSLLAFAGYGWDALFTSTKTANLDKATIWFRRLVTGILILYGVAIFLLTPFLILSKNYLITLGNQYAARFTMGDEYHLQSATYYSEKIKDLYKLLLQSVHPLNPSFLVPLLVIFAAWLILRFRGGRRFPLRWQYLWLGLIVVDVMFAEGGLRQVQSTSYVREMPESARIIQRDMANRTETPCRIYSFIDEEAIVYSTDNLRLLPPNYNMIWGLDHIGVYSPLGDLDYYQTVQELSAVNLAFGLRPVDVELLKQNRELIDFLNVCYILSRQPLSGFAEIGRDQDVTIYYNTQASPRVFLTKPIAFTAEDSPPVWPRPLPPAAAAAVIVSYEPNHIEIKAQSAQETVLVFSEVANDDWQLFVDGQRADDTLLGSTFWTIPVSPGSHTIRLVYKPQAVRLGFLASLTGILIIFLWWFVASIYPRKRKSTS